MPGNPLLRIPGLAGFVSADEQKRAQEAHGLQQLGGALTLAQALEARERTRKSQADEQAFRSEVAGLGPNPDMGAVLNAAAKYGDPMRLIELQMKSREREEAARDRALQFATNLDLRQQGLDLQREQFGQRTADAQARQKFDEFYKTESLRLRQQQDALNGQLRQMGLEVRRQGQDLQVERINQAERDRRDRGVTGFANELQQNKIPALSASITTANDLLRQYEDKDIPGFGLVEGSSMVPGAVRGEESNRVRSSVQAVSNDLLNLYSGLAVTLPEGERRELEEMRGGNFTSQDFKTAWPRIVNRYNTVLGNLRAGASPEVLQEYQSRPGALKLDPLKAAFDLPQVKNDADYAKLKSGESYIGPDGKRRTKR